MCGLSKDVRMGNAAEDVVVKVKMRTLDVFMKEMTLLKKRMKEQDMEMNVMEIRMEHLEDRDRSALLSF